MSETRAHTDSMVGLTSPGAVLGSYRILGELSSGSMGTVFRAEHLLLGRLAAVKLLRRDLTTNAELVQRFVNEAKAVTASKHPGIVEVYDFGYTLDGHAFIVMELLEGEALGHRLARVRMSEPEAVVIALGIASALKAAHKVGVIHRDLKPDNVFLVPDPDGGTDRPKVLDFGIAKLADPTMTGQTETGALIGTPMYMAPEQARAAATIDHRADLYSLGCMLYHMLTGRPPFVAEGGGEIIALQMFGQVEPPSRLAAITPEMDALVLRLLEKEPAQRPASAAEVMTQLTAIDAALSTQGAWRAAPAARLAAPSSAAVRATPSRPPQLGDDARPGLAPDKRSAMPVVAAVVTVLAIAGVAITFAALRSGSDPAPRVPASAAASPTPTPSAATPSAATAQPTTATAKPTTATAQPTTATAQPTTATAKPTAATATAKPPTAIAKPSAAAATPHKGAITKRPTSKPAPHKRPAPPPTGPVTRPADALPDRAIEVIRDIRQVEPPVSGPHTPGGSPMETTVEIDHRPKPAAPTAPPKDAP